MKIFAGFVATFVLFPLIGVSLLVPIINIFSFMFLVNHI